MGVLFIEYPNGDRYLCCLKCDCPIANASSENVAIDSGRRTYLIKKCVNVKVGHSYNKNSDSRHTIHMVRDVGCLKCNQNLGWSNEFCAEPKKLSKEGRMSIFCDKICLRNEKDQKISSRRLELQELLFHSERSEFELTASDMDTDSEDSEEEQLEGPGRDIDVPNGDNLGQYNPADFLRLRIERRRNQVLQARINLEEGDVTDEIFEFEQQIRDRVAQRREQNRINQARYNNFRRILEGL